MKKKKIQATKVFKMLLDGEKQGYNLIKLQGGSRSSKTWSILQFFIMKALEGERFKLTIVRESQQRTKETVLMDFDEMITKYDLIVYPEVNINRPVQVYKIGNSLFDFWGLDKPKRAHGRKQDYLWINEVIELRNIDVFHQLEMRTTGLVICDYNPSDEDHWIFTLDKRDDVVTYISTVKDNPFIGKKQMNKILGYEPTPDNIRQGTADQYMWEVYGCGRPAKLQGLIFENWDIIDEIPADAKDLGIGMDFGFANDPTAIVELYLYNNELYINELCYEPKLVNVSTIGERSIDEVLTKLQVGRREITADSSEPKSITELYNKGWNITGAVKGPDSVRFGIDLLKKYKLHITRKSINIEKELRKYKYQEDKDGKLYNEPVDAFNHAIDAIRYRAMAKLGNVYQAKTMDGRALGL